MYFHNRTYNPDEGSDDDDDDDNDDDDVDDDGVVSEPAADDGVLCDPDGSLCMYACVRVCAYVCV